jgi:PKHD-type hydroxylase
MIKSTTWTFKKDEIQSYAWSVNLFSPEELDFIIKKGKSLLPENATVYGNKGSTKHTEKSVRDSKVSWITPEDDTTFIFQKLVGEINDINEKFFKFNLFGFLEGLQFTQYDAPTGKYGKHVDRGYGMPIRKLSFSLQLSDPEDYNGGDLVIYNGNKPVKTKKQRGYMLVFPSFSVHEVTKLTKGTRYSLVGWIAGENFK